MSAPDADLGFAAEYDAPILYLQRIRNYYQGLGYGAPYRWAHYAEVPFQPLGKPLAECRVALITTAARYQFDKGDQGPGAPYNAAAKFYQVYSGDSAIDHDLRISHVAYDRAHTSAEDSNTWFPLRQLRAQAAAGRIGAVARHFHGAPTNRSQRTTLDQDGPELLARCRADRADAAILVPNCPVCHQTVSLAARHLEANGVATIVMGCAKDIVEFVGVPRFLFSDFPLGNSAGRPNDPASQSLTLELALRILETAPAARTTVQSPLRWPGDPSWKLDYSNIDRLPADEIHRRRAEFDRQKKSPEPSARKPRRLSGARRHFARATPAPRDRPEHQLKKRLPDRRRRPKTVAARGDSGKFRILVSIIHQRVRFVPFCGLPPGDKRAGFAFVIYVLPTLWPANGAIFL